MGRKKKKGRGREMRRPALLACRISPFAVSGRRHKLNDREGALKSEARRGKRVIYSPRPPRREQRRPRSLITAASDALIRDGKATAVSRADECAASSVSRVSHFAFRGRLLELNIRINYNIAYFSYAPAL